MVRDGLHAMTEPGDVQKILASGLEIIGVTERKHTGTVTARSYGKEV